MPDKKGKARPRVERIGFICKGCGKSYCTHIGPSAMSPPEDACIWKRGITKPNWIPLYGKEAR